MGPQPGSRTTITIYAEVDRGSDHGRVPPAGNRPHLGRLVREQAAGRGEPL